MITQAAVEILSANPLISYTEVANKLSVSREYIRQIALKELNERGKTRTAKRTGVNNVSRAMDLVSVPPDKGTASRLVWDRAKRKGLHTERVLVYQGHRPMTQSLHDLLINGFRCRIRNINNQCKTTSYGPLYAHVSSSCVEKMDFSIAVIDHSKVFVIPASLAEKNIYIPRKPRRTPYNGIKQEVDWFLYQDAWELLRK